MADQSDSTLELQPKTENALVDQVKSFVSGGFGGICAVLVGHPFDLVKVRLQTSSGSTGAIDAVKQIIKTDGPKGLYRGVTAPLVGVTPMFAISFWGYEVGKQIVRAATKKTEDAPLSTGEIMTAGFLSAIPMTAITAPFERVKVILQLQGQEPKVAEGQPKPKQYNGALDVVKHLYKEGGVRSVFRGSVATLARDGPGSALYFGAYEVIKRKLPKDAEGNPSFGGIMLAGGTAGMAMWIPVFPVDTIKSNLQSSDKAQSVAEVTRSIYARGGLKAFFPGVGPALARAFPANAATFLGVELCNRAYKSLGI